MFSLSGLEFLSKYLCPGEWAGLLCCDPLKFKVLSCCCAWARLALNCNSFATYSAVTERLRMRLRLSVGLAGKLISSDRYSVGDLSEQSSRELGSSMFRI